MRLASSKAVLLILAGALLWSRMVHPALVLAQPKTAIGARVQQEQDLTADEIVNRMLVRNQQRNAILQRYRSVRTYRLSYAGTGGAHAAEIVVSAVYTAPGVKSFKLISQTGSKVLSERVLWRLVEGERQTSERQDWQKAMFSPATYKLRLLGQEMMDGLRCWVLEVEPKPGIKSEGGVAYKGRVWIGMEDYATVRVLGEPVKNPSFMVSKGEFDSRYMRRKGVWVPSTNVSKTHVLIGGDATMTIDYGSYEELQVGPSIEQAGAIEPATDGSRAVIHAASFKERK